MDCFNIDDHLAGIYATFPETVRKPVIGITANYEDGDATLREKYYKQTAEAGGIPVIIPPLADKDVIVNTLEHIDGLLLTGGGDFNPLWAGEQPSTALHRINAERDLPELLITRLAYNRQIPMLGICRGMQTLAMALGGKVFQDIESQTDSRLKHSQDADRALPSHRVNFKENSIVRAIYDADFTYVNSFHHQAVSDPGNLFRATAYADDGIIEAMESQTMKSIVGVQWHPEWMGEHGQRLFKWLCDEAQLFMQAKQTHRQVLTLDTHCDTPMWFHAGADFTKRDPKLLVDLHKMTDGRQDAVIMAAYLPQPQMGETFSMKVNTDLLNTANVQVTPKSYADMIFDKIEDIVSHNRQYVGLARTPAQLYEDKRKGRKSIMLAIENGLALEHQLSNVRYFAQRGVVYITLCHNGDNDICDSAKGCATWGGVSQFGEKVIQEMNRQGIMVDLSHAAEKSFYDALDISAAPIVCSHSNCKALCDHPRNLTDDQLKAIAAKGGVVHVTLYHGFLNPDRATLADAIAHLEHAIGVMGIDHVGLGTDFDGDGGVVGLADSSELIQFTLQLLRKKYSLRDIQKIMGGNWLRVMGQVQHSS